MFIKSIVIKNFKGFIGDEHKIDFSTPDGETLGSGLNILIGDNNAGKSSVFEAVNFLRNGCKSESLQLIKSKLKDGSQPNDSIVEIVFSGNIQDAIESFLQDNKKAVFTGYINENGELIAKRDTADIKKLSLLSSEGNYANPSGIDAPFKSLFEANFIWADTNPNDEAKFGSTTLCGLLLKEITQEATNSKDYRDFQTSFNQLFNNPNSSFRSNIQNIEDKVKRIITEQFGDATVSFKFDELKIDSFFKNLSVFVDDGINVPLSEKGNGMQRSIALALLQVYAEQLAYVEEKDKIKPFYLFIDEPELCLHPKGQTKLLNALLEISKKQQVFVTSHSPYFLATPRLKNIGLFIFKKEGDTNKIKKISLEDSLFPWSPTWGEINFKAYELPTVEFHNELYGRLQSISEKSKEKEFDKWLIEKGLQFSKQWCREGEGKQPYDVTLQTFIRNHIHHPENEKMRESLYSEDELKRSIEEMIQILKNNGN
ncbi:ATP-dependent nuclease [Avibacterium avium]|uniref:ATP-dependent nuclease n=1 Tax=Avibacterium avium TaxID=751 RepID=UPI003BF85B7F